MNRRCKSGSCEHLSALKAMCKLSNELIHGACVCPLLNIVTQAVSVRPQQQAGGVLQLGYSEDGL